MAVCYGTAVHFHFLFTAQNFVCSGNITMRLLSVYQGGSLTPPGSGSLSLSMTSLVLYGVCCCCCSCMCLLHTVTHQHISCIPHNSVYTEQVKRSKSQSLMTMTIQKSCDVTRLYISSVTTLNI